jgi:DNA-binding GntR family transcriptional regulator
VQVSSQPVSLAEQAYQNIRGRILRGAIPLGAPLSRRRLAAELGMSLLPVAEALQALESDGLVESRPRVGTRVCMPTAEEIRERYEVREALESQAARLYSVHSTAREKRELLRASQHLDDMFQRAAAGSEDREFLFAVHNAHMRFHLRLAELARCAVLRAMIEKNHVLVFNWLFDIAASRPALPVNFHRDLTEALNLGDPESADRAMRSHVRYGLQEVVHAIGPRAHDVPFQRVK